MPRPEVAGCFSLRLDFLHAFLLVSAWKLHFGACRSHRANMFLADTYLTFEVWPLSMPASPVVSSHGFACWMAQVLPAFRRRVCWLRRSSGGGPLALCCFTATPDSCPQVCGHIFTPLVSVLCCAHLKDVVRSSTALIWAEEIWEKATHSLNPDCNCSFTAVLLREAKLRAVLGPQTA